MKSTGADFGEAAVEGCAECGIMLERAGDSALAPNFNDGAASLDEDVVEIANPISGTARPVGPVTVGEGAAVEVEITVGGKVEGPNAAGTQDAAGVEIDDAGRLRADARDEGAKDAAVEVNRTKAIGEGEAGHEFERRRAHRPPFRTCHC